MNETEISKVVISIVMFFIGCGLIWWDDRRDNRQPRNAEYSLLFLTGLLVVLVGLIGLVEVFM
jgi:MFS superfamily sulfate permease-like transporter